MASTRRKIGRDILDGLAELKRREHGRMTTLPAISQIRERTGLSQSEFTALLAPFRDVRIVPERFPVASRLHKGWKATAYNTFFVGTFNALPRSWVQQYGWHLMAFCRP